ncbi:MAG: hypothetical protein UDG94_10410 [Peptococcaceae bacterium]|nr:hypothetical protein [Peptococcaceae bacterium]
MAVIEANQVTKAKLVFQVQTEEGELRQTSRTFSDLVVNADNDALHAGLSAVAGLLDISGASVVRVDERELVSE